ncbi:MAG: peptidoglycan-binding domain-containing protein [Pseudomonadota bacterium]
MAAIGGAITIGTNALWEQSARHPAPLFGGPELAENRADEPPLVAAHAPLRQAVERPDGGLVRQVQDGLSSTGFYDGVVDGVWSDTTAQAIRKFEAYQGLELTGEPSLTLVAAIGEVVEASRVVEAEPSPPPEAVAAVTPVSTVPEIQAALNRHGYGPLSVDGVMGPQTQSAIGRFADGRGLQGRGITPALLRALAEAPR